ncbi:MAG: MFS transporter [Terriglobales bacterium]
MREGKPEEQARRALVLLAAAVLLAMAPWFTTAALVEPLRRAWGLTPSGAAWLTIAAQLGFVAGAVAAAVSNLADRVAPRLLILCGGLAAAGANAALIACPGFASAWTARFLTGAFLALVYPPALKLMATWFRARRGMALGVMVGALTVGAALPHLVAAVGGAGWRSVVVITSVITAAGGIWGGLAGREGPFPFVRGAVDVGAVGRLWRQRGVRLAICGYLGHMWELIAMWSWIGLFLGAACARAGVGRAAAAGISFAVIAAGGIGCWWGGLLSDGGGRERAAATAMAISGGCALVLGWMGGASAWALGAIIAVAVVWGFWVVADSAQFSALVTELSDVRYVGTALTLQLGLGFTLACVSVWVLPWMQSRLGWAGAFTALAPGPGLGIVAMVRLRRWREQLPASGQADYAAGG